MTDINEARRLIIETGRRMWQRGLVAANDGNISCRVAEGFLITRSGVSKGFLAEEDILLLDGSGAPLLPTAGKPSMETSLHLAIYAARPEIGAVVHSHAPHATAFTLAGADINAWQLEDLRVQLGQVAAIPYAPAGSGELARLTAAGMRQAKAGLMARHGAVTVGRDLTEAYYRMEALEQAATIILCSLSLQK